jgi:tryptophan synthase beta chain
VSSGTATLKDATSEAIRDWVTNVEDTIIYSSAPQRAAPPYPTMVRDSERDRARDTQAVHGTAWRQALDTLVVHRGGSNARPSNELS